MNKLTTTLIAIAITAFLPVFTYATDVPATSNPVSTAQSSDWSEAIVSDSSSSATPAVGDPTSSAVPPALSVSESTSTAVPSAPTVGGSTSTAVPPTPTPTPTTSGSSSGSSYSSGGSRVNYTYMYGCPMITSFMKFGADNDSAQVTKLQSFLKNVEKLDVDITGNFDKKTENAVIAFQDKYSETTMGPWGATKGTGYVYITTAKKINQIACNLPLTLNPSELSIILDKRNRNSNANNNINIGVAPSNTPAITVEVKKVTEDNTITLQPEDNVEINTASVGKASIMSRFWNFISGLFK